MSKEQEKKMTKEEREKLHRLKKKKQQKQKKKEERSNQSNVQSESSFDSVSVQTEVSDNTLARLSHQNQNNIANSEMHSNDNIEDVEYVYESEDNVLTGQYYELFKDVFKKYSEKQVSAQEQQEIEEEKNEEEQKKLQEEYEEKKAKRAQEKLEKEQNKEKLSRKQRKQQRWLQVAQLKALVKRPDLVEAWDITAPDPRTLVFLKSLKNTVPVPRHWCQKRKYLQNKRGILKQPFKLPEYIENTGIAKLRDPFSERDGITMVKQKLKERMNPKMGKIEIDYDVLHDAFFKYQTKPKLTIHGDIYYEGKEDECQSKKYKPGRMSEALRSALEISDYAPPPWLASMQRYGPPPSYPNLKIIGMTYHDQGGSFLNKVAIEEQVKQMNMPGIYGIFKSDDDGNDDAIPVPKGYWGQVIEDDDHNVEDQAEVVEDQDLDEDDLGDDDVDFEEQLQSYDKQGGQQQNYPKHAAVNQSNAAGFETPDVDIRGQPASEAPLYHVLEQVPTKGQSGAILGSQHTYIMHGQHQN
ncbi:PSP family protein (macronuclear) [Tetrahymena thermophila SB210]|uniref:PSP family protein n=1 Tax=Tetrahymena thermophila (strain SB210) TaxID=312017 RepID=Q22RK9_TETTS|nr:PSP family protein [Tetrahymena thermophila SB210]EAR88113.1 PSP family protein [Tetrahymena thermophila SB210]|eukprot:XP_001008358.1 PSP family protein [Tetrahymena thermophila SB210]